MEKTAYTLLILFISLSQANAQVLSDQKRHFISFNTGLTLPVGSLASKSDGMALIGYNYNFSGAYYIKPYVGIGFCTGEYVNPLDNNTVRDHTNGFKNSNSVVSSGLWAGRHFMIGPQVSLPLRKITFDLKFLCGFVRTYSPTIIIDNQYYGSVQPQVKANAFGYNYGIAGRIHFSNRWALRLYVDVMSSNPSISTTNNLHSLSSGNTISNTDITYSNPITVINFGAGIAYQFVK